MIYNHSKLHQMMALNKSIRRGYKGAAGSHLCESGLSFKPP